MAPALTAPETDPPALTEAAVPKARTAPPAVTEAVPKARAAPLAVTKVGVLKARLVPLAATVAVPRVRAAPMVTEAVPTIVAVLPAVTKVGVLKARTVPPAATGAAVRTATRIRALRTVRRGSVPAVAVVRLQEARTRLADAGPNPLGGQPAGAAGMGRLRGPVVAVPGRALGPVNRATRAVTADRGRPKTEPVTAAGRSSGPAVVGPGKDGVPGYPRPAVRPAAISLARTPRAFPIPSPPISLTRRPGPSSIACRTTWPTAWPAIWSPPS